MEPRLDYYTASPEALKAIMLLEAANFDLCVEKGLMELIKLRVSQLNDCAFCADMHATQARKNGESPRRLHSLVVWRTCSLFTERERAALAWCDAVTMLDQPSMRDALYEQLCAHFNEREVVDLTVGIATINCWNRIAVSFRKQPTV
ncbi:carboxymuconolactone decarboxylase family protein [Pseudomonas abietaniphila]|uniref:Alkylhydroperoxidase AhpD family core domain-containing protein n=1 Tax=Pseudomonas abietaniphila TaxID=89065 RepID=A0A1G8M8R3_9PSED|nr:carboxymuconolactone decarboxylase family protein [Pseudomonas abietaniphila]SDI64311.1 alkylhydroperoxidase AhpD family core domain-containing protein [Pseudomonas abietaniphila]